MKNSFNNVVDFRSLFKPSFELEENSNQNKTFKQEKQLSTGEHSINVETIDASFSSTTMVTPVSMNDQSKSSTLLSALTNSSSMNDAVDVILPLSNTSDTVVNTEADEQFSSPAFQIYRSGSLPRILSKGHPLLVSKNQTIDENSYSNNEENQQHVSDIVPEEDHDSGFEESLASKIQKESFGKNYFSS